MADQNDWLIAAVTCPKCGKEYPLLDTPSFEPGKQPRQFPGPDPITFPCCGATQTVQSGSVKYRPQRQFSGANDERTNRTLA
jgi:hypothetical protein